MIYNAYLQYGFLLRIIITILSIFIIPINKYLLIILPILFICLDKIDNILTSNKYTKTEYYHIVDKIIDILSYMYVYIIFNKYLHDNILEFSIFYRFIGVILFAITKEKKHLIIFFDFIKEYMLYKFIFNNNIYVLLLCIILKIIFEYIFHIHWNKYILYIEKFNS
jgi:hypothetical protein